MLDPSAQAFAAQGIARIGVAVQFQRFTGQAPARVVLTASVTAIVRDMTPDTEDPARSGMSVRHSGGISQTYRTVMVMAADLVAAGFPLPVHKNDRMLVTSTGDQFNVVRVDAQKRAFSGVIDIMVAGVA